MIKNIISRIMQPELKEWYLTYTLTTATQNQNGIIGNFDLLHRYSYFQRISTSF